MRPGRAGAGDPAARRRAERRGRSAESLALWLLRLKGYRLIARRARTPVGEIDLIVRRGRVLAAVEVKARASLQEAAETLGVRQRRRVAQAFDYWLALQPDLARLDRRFDLVLVAPGRPPRHLPDAWRPDA
ncbi:MAG: YraN family protein [Alphaproteobacteria bacterium]|nr:YraN family protein [Alphaproteobacteria bacterium]